MAHHTVGGVEAKAAWKRNVSTSKKGATRKRPGTVANANRGKRGHPDSRDSLGSYSVEEQAVMDRGLRILARMLARAHLHRHDVLASGARDSTHEDSDASAERGSAQTPASLLCRSIARTISCAGALHLTQRPCSSGPVSLAEGLSPLRLVK